MALQLPPSLSNTLAYFNKYNYPLTPEELWYWQHATTYSQAKINKLYSPHLKDPLWKQRVLKKKHSQAKWMIARQISDRLKKIPTVQAVLVTGALAMNNCPQDDDIDLMLVVAPQTLWLTRLVVNIWLRSLLRKPQRKARANQICLNLWLDTQNLAIPEHDLYRAHEVLQAKLVWQRSPVHEQFLRTNIWTRKFLPVAYKQLSEEKVLKRLKNPSSNILVQLVNLSCFVFQYLYMQSKMTTEQVGLGFAYFHPSKPN